MRLSRYPHCCGIKILEEFPYDFQQVTQKQIENEIELKTRYISSTRIIAAIVISGYNTQNKAAAALKSSGFQELRRFNNKNTGNKLQMFIKFHTYKRPKK